MAKITPYTTKKGIQIGIYYERKINYHNPDQDWIQKKMLGAKPDWTYHIDNFVEYVLMLAVGYAILGLLSRGWYE
jgi:hypothetical protein